MHRSRPSPRKAENEVVKQERENFVGTVKTRPHKRRSWIIERR